MKKLYVIGWPINHSRSPLIHNYWLKKHSIDAKYELKEIEPKNLPDFINTFNKEECVGFNITIPHKEAVFDLVKTRGDLANILSATNVISWQNNGLFADNTDGYGFYKNLIDLSGWHNISAPVIIYGAGGASRAVIQAMKDAGAKDLYVYNRTVSRAKKLLEDLDIKATVLNNQNELDKCLEKAGLFINCTNLGMHGSASLDVDLALMPRNAIIADIVYTPLKTDLLKQAEKLGLKNVDGLGMLLHQAAKAFEIWFGILPEVDQTIRNLVIDDLKS
ncbi:MAG: shikimate dehydrogenase [Rhizobiales bacterium]|nr:shikimate dehydrogenase [Hyphomicrobiales bacterium]